jgi:hypothetical protein
MHRRDRKTMTGTTSASAHDHREHADHDHDHDHEHGHCPHIVVHPLDGGDPPCRRVEVLGATVGRAASFTDLERLCRQAGLEGLDLRLPGSVRWDGGGSDVWK